MADRSRKQKQWTLTGAARSAREARIAGAAFLSTPAMARWHELRLKAAYAYHKRHRGDHHLALGQLYGGMGYRPPYPDWQAGSEMVLADEARFLAEADLYIMSPEMCDVVTAAALTLDVTDLSLVNPDDLPALSGLVVLPHPLICRAVTGDLSDIRAFTWRHPAEFLKLAVGDRLDMLPAVRVSTYTDAHGPVQPDSFTDFAAKAAAEGTPLPSLFLDAIRCWPYQQEITSEVSEHLRRFAASIRQLGEQAHADAARLGLDG